MPRFRSLLRKAKQQVKQIATFPRLSPCSSNFQQLFTGPIRRLASGFQFTEGPIWMDGGLLFSDIPANKIYRLDAKRPSKATHKVSLFRSPSGNANGLTLDLQGRLIACEHSNRRVTRTETDGSITVLADRFAGKQLNSPNDVIVSEDGCIYFTDPPYGIQPHEQEQPVQGVYCIDTDGKLTLLVTDFERPNGLAFSPDGRQLYIDDSQRRHVRQFACQPDGTLTGSEIFCSMAVEQPGLPDGMKVDPSGNLFCTGPGGVWVWDANGALLGQIMLPEQPTNCAWGDDDYRGLYITAQTSVYHVRCRQPGWVPHLSPKNG